MIDQEDRPFDFFEDARDPQVFLGERDAWTLADTFVDGELMWSTKNMNEQELIESIIDDVLDVTMWEIQTGKKLDVTVEKLLRFTNEDMKSKIRELIENNPYVGSFVGVFGTQVRIHGQNITAAMEACGAYYDYHGMMDDIKEQLANAEETVENKLTQAAALEQYGSLENMAKALSMELEQNVPDAPKTLH